MNHHYRGIVMTRAYKKHSGSFKLKVALEAIKEQKTLNELSREYDIAPTQISAWKKQLEENGAGIFEGKKGKENHQEELDKLHRIIGQIEAERDFLVRALSR